MVHPQPVDSTLTPFASSILDCISTQDFISILHFTRSVYWISPEQYTGFHWYTGRILDFISILVVYEPFRAPDTKMPGKKTIVVSAGMLTILVGFAEKPTEK